MLKISSTNAIIVTYAPCSIHNQMLATEVLGAAGFAAESQLYFTECSPVKIEEKVNCPMYRYLGKMDQKHMNQFIQMLPGDDTIKVWSFGLL